MDIAIIVQARMGSSRLPGKVLMPVKGKPLLTYLIERLRLVKGAFQMVVATGKSSENRPIIDLCDKMRVKSYVGSDNDVMARFALVAEDLKPDAIVRITADNPLIDPGVVDDAISFFLDSGATYISNVQKRSFPVGQDVEVFETWALEEACYSTNDPYDREHVTPYFYKGKEDEIPQLTQSQDKSHLRMTVDTLQDFSRIEKLIGGTYSVSPMPTLEEMTNWLESHHEV